RAANTPRDLDRRLPYLSPRHARPRTNMTKHYQELSRYKLAFNYLRAQALNIERSAALLDQVGREL
ncbi:hypothetical protein ACFXKV_13650, partial [Streptomyces globisporus]